MDQTIILLASFIFVFSVVIIPYIVVMQLREKVRKQRLESRIQTLNKQNLLPSIKFTRRIIAKQESSLTLAKFFIYMMIILPIFSFSIFIESFSVIISSAAVYLGVIIVGYFLIKKIRERHFKKAFINQFPNHIDQIIRNLRAGRTITDSIRAVSQETKGPISEQFRSIVDQVDLGKEFIFAVTDVSSQLRIPEFTFFVIVLSVQQETGGNIIKTLSSLANMLRRRQLMRLKIKSLSAEGIVSAFFMGSLPFIVAGVILLIRPEYLSVLFADPTGQNLLIAGVISELMGCVVIARMVHIDI